MTAPFQVTLSTLPGLLTESYASDQARKKLETGPLLGKKSLGIPEPLPGAGGALKLHLQNFPELYLSAQREALVLSPNLQSPHVKQH